MAVARKKIELFLEIQNEKEFEHALKIYANQLICAEIYCTFAGSCTALDRLFTTIKLDWSSGEIVLLKVPADEIQVLERFKNYSEPVFMFILEWISKISEIRQLEERSVSAKRAARQAARKRHRAELMVPHLQILNFVLFWPHCYHAHPELYEKWDANNIIMIGREEVNLTEELARDILYAGDAPMNEASLHTLLSGKALAICFRLLDTDKHFVSLVRKILYEDLPEYDDSKPADAQTPRVTAFDLYKSYSPTREVVMENRQRERIKRREEAVEKRARRLSEMQRLAQQDIVKALEDQKKRREERRLELLKSGNLDALKKFDMEPDEEIRIEIPDKLPDEYEAEESDEDPDEYLPPPGLLVPGFYAPPNDVAKANGLVLLFPKITSDYVIPESEFLPPHVLLMLEIEKAKQFIKIMKPYTEFIINMGIFKATSPFDSEFITYSVKQFETMDKDSLNCQDVKLAVMLSIEMELPLLLLSELVPCHVSRDKTYGADECAELFPVDYPHLMEDFEQSNVYMPK